MVAEGQSVLIHMYIYIFFFTLCKKNMTMLPFENGNSFFEFFFFLLLSFVVASFSPMIVFACFYSFADQPISCATHSPPTLRSSCSKPPRLLTDGLITKWITWNLLT